MLRLLLLLEWRRRVLNNTGRGCPVLLSPAVGGRNLKRRRSVAAVCIARREIPPPVTGRGIQVAARAALLGSPPPAGMELLVPKELPLASIAGSPCREAWVLLLLLLLLRLLLLLLVLLRGLLVLLPRGLTSAIRPRLHGRQVLLS